MATRMRMRHNSTAICSKVWTSRDGGIYTYLSLYIYIGGWGGESNWEIVSFRSCVRAQLYARSEWISKMIPHPFSLFPFDLEIPSLFPCESRCSLSLEIIEIKEIQVRSSESKWDKKGVQPRSSESTSTQVKSSESK